MSCSLRVLSFAALTLLACGGENTEAPPESSSGASTMAESPASTETASRDEAAPEVAPPEEEPGTREAPPAPTTGVDLGPWAVLLRTYRTDDGGFRYAALHGNAEDRASLTALSERLAEASAPEERDAALAFYINAYNVLTVNAVMALWPTENVLEEEGFFDERTHRLTGEDMTLNHLENQIIRSERFAEPRIHFAVNCASTSCPPLQAVPFDAENLETLLAQGAQEHVRRTTELRGRRATISQLFEWFAADFERVGGVRTFVAAQLEEDDAEVVRNEGTRIRYRPYDWSINARP